MKTIIIIIGISILGALLYALTIKGVYGNISGEDIKGNYDQNGQVFELSPERDRYILTDNLAKYKSFALTEKLAEAAYPDVGFYGGKFFIFFAPGISILALPFYELGKNFNLAQVFSYYMVSIFAIFNLIFIYLICNKIFKLPLWASLISAVIFGFGSTSWAYATTLYQHQVTTFFIISSFYAVWKFRQNKKLKFIWAIFVWINFGSAVSIDYPNIILMLPIMIYFLISAIKIEKGEQYFKFGLKLSFLLTSIFLIIIALANMYFNYINFGNWKTLSGSIPGYKTILQNNIFESSNSAQQLTQIQDQKNPVGFFKEERIIQGLDTLLFSADRSIFLYSPIFILAIFGMFYSFEHLSLEKNVLLSLVAVHLFLYASWSDPWGGWAFGSRYLIPTMAILSIFIGIFLSKFKYKFLSNFVAFLLLIFSVAVALLGVLTTNAIPPETEAIPLNTGYNFMRNLEFFNAGRSTSFIYNQYLVHLITLKQYFLAIYIPLIGIIFILLIIPLFKRHEVKD